MKTTILFLIDSLQVLGGAEKNLLQVASGLDRDKYNVIVCCLKAGNACQEFETKGINVIILRVKRIYDFNALIKAIKLIKLLRKEKVKIMVTYLESSDFWGSIIAKVACVLVVISSRRDMGFNLKRRHLLCYRVINHLFNKIITVSDAVKEAIVKREKVTPNKIVTIYNGVNIYQDNGFNKPELKKSLGLDIDKRTVTMLANFELIKGHKDFLTSASEVIKKNSSVQFLLAGTGINGYEQDLREFVNKLGIKDNVIFSGFRPDSLEVLSISDISVISSISEGFSNTILESMAAGKPVIATQTGGNPEAVINGETGLLIPPKDSEALANAILLLLGNRDLAQKMGEVARERVKRLFSAEIMLKDIQALFDILLEKRYATKKTKIINRRLSRLLKIFLSNILYYSGIINLFERLKSHKYSITILAYHKISDNSPYLNLSTTISSFKAQMKFLKQHYQIISLEKAIDLLKTKQEIKRKSVVITFDDGDESVFQNALPVLKEFSIPATIFLTVEPIENREPLWFEFIISAIHNTTRKTLDLERYGLKKYLLDAFEEKNEAVEQIVPYVKKLHKKLRKAFIEDLCRELLVDENEIKTLSCDVLTWGEIKKMGKDGVSFGAHTMTHTILTNLSLDEAEYEISASKRIIEERLGEKVSLFAYPNGGRGDFNEDTINLLKNYGFSCACSLIKDNNNNDLFALPRIYIHEGSITDVSGAFSKGLFATTVSRIFKHLFK